MYCLVHTKRLCGHFRPYLLLYGCMISSSVLECCWQPLAHEFMKDRADVTCPTVGPVKKRARPTFHLGHTSCVCDCVCTSLFYPFIYELSHAASYEDGVKSHQLGKGAVGFSRNPSFSLAPPPTR